MATILVLSLVGQGVDYNIFVPARTPISVDQGFLIWQWAVVFVLQFLFVIIPLPCMRTGQHYKNIVLIKIGWSFLVLCVLQTIAALTFTVYDQNFSKYFISCFAFFALKSKHPLNSF